jgi:Fur family ferric uptake transcriptional regulator
MTMTSERPESHVDGQRDVLKSILNQEGRRLTSQRQKILTLFETAFQGEHLSAEEIYQQLSRRGEKISPSTIYRTLHVMVELGILREVELAEGKKFYELSTPFASQHHHLVCVQCGAVDEFEEDRVTQTSQRETMDRGFSLLNCQFTVYGICPQCQRSFTVGE